MVWSLFTTSLYPMYGKICVGMEEYITTFYNINLKLGVWFQSLDSLRLISETEFSVIVCGRMKLSSIHRQLEGYDYQHGIIW